MTMIGSRATTGSTVSRFVLGSMGIATTLGISYVLVKKLHHTIEFKYGGLDGLLRLIWEGDHLPPHIRMSVELLDEISEKYIGKETRRLQKIEVSIQAAKMNSVDHEYETLVMDPSHMGPSSSSSAAESTGMNQDEYPKYYILAQTPTLKKELSLLSQNLDKIAAKVDEIPSYNDIHVKSQKKKISKCIVDMMETADRYIHECGVSLTKK